MSESLRRLGVEVVALASGGFEVRGGDADWLRAVFVAFGHHAQIDGTVLHLPSADLDRVERTVRAALAPDAVLLDLDGVLADIARRTSIAEVEDVAALAVHYPIAVVTTCPRRLAESVLERHGFLSFIQVVVGSEDGPCKPDPFPVQFAMQQLGKQTAWMLGDNPSDVIAARAAGAVPLAIMPHGIGAESHVDRLRAAGAVRFLAGVGELRSVLPGV